MKVFEVEFNEAEQLLTLRYSQRVNAEQMKAGLEEIKKGMPQMKPGFRLLAELCDMEHMDPECAAYIGQVMELFDAHGIGAVVRVIPDPYKDIGFNLLTRFHYKSRVPVRTFENCKEARESLGIPSAPEG